LSENEQVETVTFAALADSIRARRTEDGPRCLVVGVDGMSGAGKTGFAHRLAAELSVPCIGGDETVCGWDGLAASLEELATGLLAPLSRGEPGRWRRYDWVGSKPAEWIEVPGLDLVVIEGCCVGVPPVGDHLSYLIWLDAPDTERRRRLAARADWDSYAPNFDRWRVQETALQAGARTEERADLVVDNSEPTLDAWSGGRFVRR
jgi:uridine kinase